jgi:hypothetical protein
MKIILANQIAIVYTLLKGACILGLFIPTKFSAKQSAASNLKTYCNELQNTRRENSKKRKKPELMAKPH